ncbi:hypothetical protein [Thalassobacillus devorans]|uniref:hypothetical protein n=1 Tax=Thalassobacillus devorans TaxID=279813 RepID=UPI00048F940C|nr:hypothetical protein [Thalassobacillus devorans]
MAETYTDYVNRVAITVPDEYIDIKTGESHFISKKTQEQIAYHATNSTLVHLVFSALENYFSEKTSAPTADNNDEILKELASIKKMLSAHPPVAPSRQMPRIQRVVQKEIDPDELDDVLEAFGG